MDFKIPTQAFQFMDGIHWHNPYLKLVAQTTVASLDYLKLLSQHYGKPIEDVTHEEIIRYFAEIDDTQSPT